jgi:hypothetical protein
MRPHLGHVILHETRPRDLLALGTEALHSKEGRRRSILSDQIGYLVRQKRLISAKETSLGILGSIIQALILIVGFWLAVAAFLLRDLREGLFFIAILLIIYISAVVLIYRKGSRAKQPATRNSLPNAHNAWFVQKEQGEEGIKLTILKRRR